MVSLHQTYKYTVHHNSCRSLSLLFFPFAVLYSTFPHPLLPCLSFPFLPCPLLYFPYHSCLLFSFPSFSFYFFSFPPMCCHVLLCLALSYVILPCFFLALLYMFPASTLILMGFFLSVSRQEDHLLQQPSGVQTRVKL